MWNLAADQMKREDLDFCWNQAVESDSWFRLHFTFAPKPVAKQILALHALFAQLERPATMSEESLALAQLAWWQAELSAQAAAVSAHPVVRTLRESAALENLSNSIREGLVAQALEISRRSRPSKVDDLKILCSRVGEARILSELAIGSGGRTVENPGGDLPGTGLSRLLANSPRSGFGLWFVPLDLLARFQGSAQVAEPSTPGSRALIDALGDLGEEWFDEQLETVQRIVFASGAGAGAAQHVFASMASERLYMKRTLANLREGRGVGPGRWRVTDLVKVWRDCRKFSKKVRREPDG